MTEEQIDAFAQNFYWAYRTAQEKNTHALFKPEVILHNNLGLLAIHILESRLDLSKAVMRSFRSRRCLRRLRYRPGLSPVP